MVRQASSFRTKRASTTSTAASVQFADEEDGPAEEDVSSRMEKGLLSHEESRKARGQKGYTKEETRIAGFSGRCSESAYAARLHCESLCDVTAWRSLDRLVFAFRSTQYQDLVISLVSLVMTWRLGNQYERKDVQIPVVSMLISSVAIFAVFTKLVYSSLLLWYLQENTSVGPEVIFPETVLAALRIAIGLLIVLFGTLASSKIARMKRQRKTVLLIGLDGHGKSLLVDTALSSKASRGGRKGALSRGEWEINPTAGLRMHELRKFDSFWRIWDMSGNGRGRALWPFYYGSVDAIFFVIDASDLTRLGVAKREFLRMAEHADVRRKAPALVIILNKTDLPETGRSGEPSRITSSQIRELLRFDTLSKHFKLHVQSASALQGFGMDDALQWLTNHLSGITAEENCVTEFNKFKLQNSHKDAKRRYLVFRIVGEKIELTDEGPEDKTWEDFIEELSKDEKDGAYGLFDFHTEGPDGRILQKIIFVAWTPDSLPIKAKMLYGSSRESFKSELGSGIAYVIQATDVSDVDEAEVTEMVVKGR
ncbi:ADP-ribosylation factor [Hondaea fermentalgiana]|uniref:ADP-ribosylation factor n=1 Tax=Hondaea fermentalgiana TaxID=2315210 RepID=A0A2R5GM70_9STRA|nr:ADP-ribosylation factor [Hondaea fermentalgiana]|eukprot:GBG31409.1 ADP-ribosylation factor [Hondaea fermentalgiana]